MSLGSQISGSECRFPELLHRRGHEFVCVKMGVPRENSIKINNVNICQWISIHFNNFDWISIISNTMTRFPGFLMGAPGALEISRRRGIALRDSARASAAAFAAREASGARQRVGRNHFSTIQRNSVWCSFLVGEESEEGVGYKPPTPPLPGHRDSPRPSRSGFASFIPIGIHCRGGRHFALFERSRSQKSKRARPSEMAFVRATVPVSQKFDSREFADNHIFPTTPG